MHCIRCKVQLRFGKPTLIRYSRSVGCSRLQILISRNERLVRIVGSKKRRVQSLSVGTSTLGLPSLTRSTELAEAHRDAVKSSSTTPQLAMKNRTPEPSNGRCSGIYGRNLEQSRFSNTHSSSLNAPELQGGSTGQLHRALPKHATFPSLLTDASQALACSRDKIAGVQNSTRVGKADQCIAASYPHERC